MERHHFPQYESREVAARVPVVVFGADMMPMVENKTLAVPGVAVAIKLFMASLRLFRSTPHRSGPSESCDFLKSSSHLLLPAAAGRQCGVILSIVKLTPPSFARNTNKHLQHFTLAFSPL